MKTLKKILPIVMLLATFVASGSTFTIVQVFFMKEIQLSKGYKAIVDDQDFELLNSFNWFVNVQKDGYVRAVKNKTLKCNHTKMHRMILNITDPNILVDHKDGNPLNNQRNNLRTCNDSQSTCNVSSARGSTSKYLGVSFHKQGQKWRATIFKDYKQISLGYFETEEQAALAYNEKAKELHGEFARLNVIK